MTGNELRERIRDGRRVFGSLIVSDSARWPGVMSGLGLDYVFIDTEHIAIDRKDLSWMCQLYRQMGLPPLVRIPSPSPYEATKVLDAGACGVLAPYVETREEVEGLIAAVKTRPLKGAKVKDLIAGKIERVSPMKEYLEGHNRDHFLLINIESPAGVANLDTLLTYDELDGVVIGPHDLSCSHDMPEAYDDPRFVALVSSIIKKARDSGKGAGIHVTWETGTEQEIRWAADGANIIIHKADIILFTEGLRREISTIRGALDDPEIETTAGANINI